jgi:hypothetical protein
MKKKYLKETLSSDLLRNTAVNHFMRHLIYRDKQIQSNDKKHKFTSFFCADSNFCYTCHPCS